LPIYQSYMSDIMTALSTGSVEKVSTIYNNFFREPCSVGLHGLPVDMFQHFFVEQIDQLHKKKFLNDFLHRYRLWRSTIGHSAAVDTLKSPDIGNPYGFTVDNVFIRAGSDYLHYYASMIARLIRGGKQRKVVVELGGGFGGMPYYLVRDNSDITYVDFDLPENLALTAFYLLSAFPDKRVALYGEVDIETLNPCDYDVVLMPNFEIARMPDSSADLVFNSYSLAEMSSEAVDNYLGHFNRLSNKFIFHINHTRDSVVKADEFKVDLNKFELVYRAPALWNMARNIEMDEFEYLFKNKSLVFAEPQVAH
jgi:putative sugar O-methyltransferase